MERDLLEPLATPAAVARGPSYEELFHRHFAGLVRLAALLGADDPADIAQEAFVRLHRRQALLRDETAALAYARRTVVNLTHSRLRHLRVARRALPALLAQPTVSAEELVVTSDQRARLLAAVHRLSPRHRELIVLRYWLDLSGPQIADTLGIPVGTVKSQTSRALTALARRMESSR